jgi:hypothetical protein
MYSSYIRKRLVKKEPIEMTNEEKYLKILMAMLDTLDNIQAYELRQVLYNAIYGDDDKFEGHVEQLERYNGIVYEKRYIDEKNVISYLTQVVREQNQTILALRNGNSKQFEHSTIKTRGLKAILRKMGFNEI